MKYKIFCILKKYAGAIALGLGLLVAVAVTQFGAFAQQCDSIRAQTLRLHVVAQSDSIHDQEVKLQVRDAIVTQLGNSFAVAEKQQALQQAQTDLSQIEQTAQSTLQQLGETAEVNVYLTNMYFATTQTQNVVLPAGRYDAVRVEIGAAKGGNWWGVLFPQLGVSAAVEEKEEKANPLQNAVTYSKQQQTLMQSGYDVRFASVELWEQLKESTKGKTLKSDSTGHSYR
ncbi:MAG: stage II sporulation protein R [Oscillospiraceae bacterium]|nr:stage II sporulation protein R [Oscillospiraceae bacterium]